MTLTKEAAEYLKSLITPEANILYVSVVGGGCSGLNYALSLVSGIAPTDKEFESHGIKLATSPKSHLFIKDMVIGYSGGLTGTGFTFDNPNAKRTCGCGTSFNT